MFEVDTCCWLLGFFFGENEDQVIAMGGSQKGYGSFLHEGYQYYISSKYASASGVNEYWRCKNKKRLGCKGSLTKKGMHVKVTIDHDINCAPLSDPLNLDVKYS